METKLDLTIEFVKASQSGGMADSIDVSNASSSLAQTGDPILFGTFATIIILLLGLWGVFAYYRKKHVVRCCEYDYLRTNITPRQHFFSNVFLAFFKNTIVVIASCIIAAILMIIGLSCTFSKSAYADENNLLKPSTSNITSYVHDDGSLSFSSVSLLNVSEYVCDIESSSISINNEAKSLKSLQSSNFTINGFGGIVFQGNPGDTEYTCNNTTPLKMGESTELTFALNNIDQSCLNALIDKSVFTITLNLKKHFNLNIEANDYGTLTCDKPFYAVEGDIVTLTASPNEDCVIHKWETTPDIEITLSDSTNPNVYTFTMPASNISIKACFEVLHSLTYNGHKYYPIFNGANGISGVKFYDFTGSEITNITDMKSLSESFSAEYYTVDDGVSFKGATTLFKGTSIYPSSYNDIFGVAAPAGVNTQILSTFTDNYGLYDDEKVELLTNSSSLTEGTEPIATVDGVPLSKIWEAYKSSDSMSTTGFGGQYGSIWSCVAKDQDNAFYWGCGTGKWKCVSREFVAGMNVCVSKEFGNSSQSSVKQCWNNNFDVQTKSNSKAQNNVEALSMQTQQSSITAGQQIDISNYTKLNIETKDSATKNNNDITNSLQDSCTDTITQVGELAEAQHIDSVNSSIGETALVAVISTPV